MVAKTLYGLEDVLAEELKELGAENIQPGRRMVAFEGDKRFLYKANLHLRTALRILKPILKFRAEDADQVYAALREFDWSEIMDVKKTFAVDPVIYSEHFHHSRYVGYRTKDAICDYFVEREGKRPSVRLNNPDILINIHISHTDVTVSLDSSGESLHKRGYRVAQTEAPLSEVLAAGILKMAGWKDETDLIDPMCGSGTFLIEAALMSTNIAPGIYRPGFAFQSWHDYDEELFMELYNDDSEERTPIHKIYGSDISPEAIRIAQKNIARAGLSKYIELEVMPMQQRPQPKERSLIVTNPPYGERLRLSDANDLYSMIGERLKHNYPGCEAWVLAYKPEHFDKIGLRHNRRESLMNGALECELRCYELFSGTMSEFRSEEAREGRRENRREANRYDKRQTPFERGRKDRTFDRGNRSGERKREDNFERRGYKDNGKPFDRRRSERDNSEELSKTPYGRRPGSVVTSFSEGLQKEVKRFDRDDSQTDRRDRKPTTEDFKRKRRRVNEYRSGKVSQKEELAKIDRIRSHRKENTAWPKDRRMSQERTDESQEDPFALIEDQFRLDEE